MFVKSNGLWKSKDDMVNRAIDELKKITDTCLLWEIDADEQWRHNQIIKSEKEFVKNGSKTGKFNVIQFVGKNLITEGKDWSGKPFVRLWDWKGEYFEKHESMTTENMKNILRTMIYTAFGFAKMDSIDVVYPKISPKTKQEIICI